MIQKVAYKLNEVTSQDAMTLIRIVLLLAALISALLMPEFAGAGPGGGAN